MKRHATPALPSATDQERIRGGQRRLIFAVAAVVGLRDEQLHDLVEGVSGDRTRALAYLTVGEARRLTGVLKTLERNGDRIRAAAAKLPPAPVPTAEEIANLRRVVRATRLPSRSRIRHTPDVEEYPAAPSTGPQRGRGRRSA